MSNMQLSHSSSNFSKTKASQMSFARLIIIWVETLLGAIVFAYIVLAGIDKGLELLHLASEYRGFFDKLLIISAFLPVFGFIALGIFGILTCFLIALTCYRLFPFIVSVEGAVQITTKSHRFVIHRSDIVHIFDYGTGITLVWKLNGELVSLYIRKMFFGKKTLRDISKILSQFESYTEDERQMKRISKELKLNHIFRKNRLEYYLCRPSKLNALLDVPA